MFRPTVSVIVPIYNTEKYLKMCIDSIIQQTYEKLEIILVNDGSTDKSAEICDRYRENDWRVKVIHKKNGGLVSARKTGISFATGDYVTYVDSDDWIDLDRIERMTTAAVEKNTDLVYGMFRLQYPDNKLWTKSIGVAEGYYEGRKYTELVEGIVDINNFYINRLPLSLWAFLFRTDVIKAVQMTIPEGIRFNEDIACLFGVMLRSKSMEVLGDGGYYYYRKHQDSMCHNVRKNERKNVKLFYDFYKNAFNDVHLSTAIERELLLYTYFALFCHDYSALALGEGYLFPFKEVTSDKKIAVYGAGSVGVMIVSYCVEYNFASVVLWVDRAFESYRDYEEKYGIKVVTPEDVFFSTFDYLVISLTDNNVATIVKENMIQEGIPIEKIVCFGETDSFTEKKLQQVFEESKI